ncbi:RNA-binding protein Raly [Heterocephalus glaber]|uniref:RNA-binding protein Raly n=1 Tax=Heterocephalus glaber TaxID=10181 RepID=G5B3M9_HETGA|nr:RNA-binding protein Raly [Heterocephalus glaber]
MIPNPSILESSLVTKSEVETIFSTYGRVAACSVHKGYAFVQCSNERHAPAAVLGENGRVLAGQTLDINMAGEPKPNRPKGLKRAASAIHRLFDYRGRLSLVPVPKAVPVKRPRGTVPLVHRVKTTIPVKLFACSRAMTTGSTQIKLKSNTPQEEAQTPDDGDEGALLTHNEEGLDHSQDTDAEDGPLQ